MCISQLLDKDSWPIIILVCFVALPCRNIPHDPFVIGDPLFLSSRTEFFLVEKRSVDIFLFGFCCPWAVAIRKKGVDRVGGCLSWCRRRAVQPWLLIKRLPVQRSYWKVPVMGESVSVDQLEWVGVCQPCRQSWGFQLCGQSSISCHPWSSREICNTSKHCGYNNDENLIN